MCKKLSLVLMLAFALSGCARDVVATPEDPGLVFLDAELGHEQVMADLGGEILARVRVRTGDFQPGERAPLNLALVIDTSGSMMGEPIEKARDAALAVVDMMRDGDFLAVVAFGTEPEILLPSTEVDRGALDELREKISEMEASGTTDMAGGLQHGWQQVLQHRTGETIDRIVLLGDGVPNDPNPILPLATQAGQHQIPIAALGLGLEYDEQLMGQIAELSHGNFTYVEDAEQVASLFQQQVLAVEQMLARNVVLHLQPGPGVEIAEVIGQNTPGGGGGLQLALGDLSEGDVRELVVRMSAPGRRKGALVELLDTRITFQDTVNNAGQLRRTAFLGARATDDHVAYEASRNDAVHEAAAALRAATATLTAIRMVRTGELGQATALLREAQQYVTDEEQAASIESLRREVESLDAEYSDDAPMTAPAPRPSYERSIREAHGRSMDALGY